VNKEDKQRITAYREILANLSTIDVPGDIVETKEGFLRKRVVARHFVFSSIEDAEKAKRQATELIREINTYVKRIKNDIRTIRQMYKEMAGNVGFGSGLIGAVFGNKQGIIQAKAKAKRQYASEEDARIKDYEHVLSDFEK
jgi:hypothetical protein